VRVAGWVEEPVVRVVKVGELSTLSWKDGVGRITGDGGPLTQHDVADVEDCWMLSHLLKNTALVEKCPDHSTEQIVSLILGFMLGFLPEKLVSMVVVVHTLSCHQNILLRVHTFKFEPPITSCYSFHNFVHIKILWNLKCCHVNVIIRVHQTRLLLATFNAVNFAGINLLGLIVKGCQGSQNHRSNKQNSRENTRDPRSWIGEP